MLSVIFIKHLLSFCPSCNLVNIFHLLIMIMFVDSLAAGREHPAIEMVMDASKTAAMIVFFIAKPSDSVLLCL